MRDPAVEPFGLGLNAGVVAHAAGWRLQRMALVDRNVLRLGGYEILFTPETPAAVALERIRVGKVRACWLGRFDSYRTIVPLCGPL